MSKEIETVIKAAKIAGEKIEYYFESSLEHHEKEDTSIVTKADLEADEIIIKETQSAFPGHRILSEEKGRLFWRRISKIWLDPTKQSFQSAWPLHYSWIFEYFSL